jgi:large subunit ribosomal protein L17
MRHQVKGRKLGRSTPHRKATLKALSVALIDKKRIQTTLPKAKELRTYIEPVINRAKNDTTHNRRQAFAALQDKYAVTELFESVGPAVGDRPGGYTRVLKIGKRLGDSADMAVIELVDFNDVKPEKKESKKKRTRRAGKSVKTTQDDAPASEDEPVKEKKAKKAKAEKAEVKEEKPEKAETKTTSEPVAKAESEEEEVKKDTSDPEKEKSDK